MSSCSSNPLMSNTAYTVLDANQLYWSMENATGHVTHAFGGSGSISDAIKVRLMKYDTSSKKISLVKTALNAGDSIVIANVANTQYVGNDNKTGEYGFGVSPTYVPVVFGLGGAACADSFILHDPSGGLTEYMPAKWNLHGMAFIYGAFGIQSLKGTQAAMPFSVVGSATCNPPCSKCDHCVGGKCVNSTSFCSPPSCVVQGGKCVPVKGCKNCLSSDGCECDSTTGACGLKQNCTNNSDCGSNLVCNARGQCDVKCTSKCPAGQVCLRGQCTTDKCNVPNDCAQGFTCDNNKCTPEPLAACTKTSDCSGSGETCVCGVCVPPPSGSKPKPKPSNKPCSAKTPCTDPKEHCVKGKCVPKPSPPKPPLISNTVLIVIGVLVALLAAYFILRN